MKLLLLVALCAVTAAAETWGEAAAEPLRYYHETVGVAEAERIRAAEEAAEPNSERIVGGNASGLGAFPYQVSAVPARRDRRRASDARNRVVCSAGRAGDHADDGRHLRVRNLAADQLAHGDGGALLVGRPQPSAPVPGRARIHLTVFRRCTNQYQQRADARQLERQ